MAGSTVAPPRVKADARFTPAGLRLLLASVVAISAGVVFSVPIPVTPTEAPILVVRRSADRGAHQADRVAARALPRSPHVDRLREGVLEAGRREAHRQTPGLSMEDEAAWMENRVEAAVAAHGDDVLSQLRAALALQAEVALGGARRDEAGQALLGGFETALDEWGIRRKGRVVAPPLVVRTLFKARVSVILRRPPTEGLSRAELRAYHGWLSMHGRAAHSARRVDAAASLAQVDTSYEAREMLAFGLLTEGSYAAAATLYGRLAQQTGSTRVRNHARAVSLAAEL